MCDRVRQQQGPVLIDKSGSNLIGHLKILSTINGMLFHVCEITINSSVIRILYPRKLSVNGFRRNRSSRFQDRRN